MELDDVIRRHLNEHARLHSQVRKAKRFGVSRQTLWRFPERGQIGRRLPLAALEKLGRGVEGLEMATRGLSVEPASRIRPPPTRSLSDELLDALLHLCEAPLTTAGEMAQLNRNPVSTLGDQLVKLSSYGLVDCRSRRLIALGPRAQRRYFPTEAGIRAVCLNGSGLLTIYPMLKQWFKLLVERLDAVALRNQVAALVAEADPEGQPVQDNHYRQGPYAALLTLPGGRSVGLLRQRPLLPAASLRFRLRTIARLDWSRTPRLTLVLNGSEQDTCCAVRALADPSEHESAFVACGRELIARGAHAQVLQQGAYGYPNTHTIAPDASLARFWTGSRSAMPHTRNTVRPIPTPTRPTPQCPGEDAEARRATRGLTLHAAHTGRQAGAGPTRRLAVFRHRPACRADGRDHSPARHPGSALSVQPLPAAAGRTVTC